MQKIGRAVLGLMVMCGAVLGTYAAAAARTATIEIAAPLHEHSDEGVQSALKEAVQSAAKGAMAMGLEWMQVSHAAVVGDSVAVQVLATDTPQSDSSSSSSNSSSPAPKGDSPSVQPNPPDHPSDQLKADAGDAPTYF